MDLTKKKTEIEAELANVNEKITNLEWQKKTLIAQLRRVNKLIETATKIMADADTRKEKTLDKENTKAV